MSTSIPFVKMHGAGNDFILMDARSTDFPMDVIRDKTPSLCRRRTGIGADGVLMLGDSENTDDDFTMHYLNADGSEAGMCGNGARCLARFAVSLGFPRKLTFRVHNKIYRADVHDGYVSIFFPVRPVPEPLKIDNTTWYHLNAGNEHVVSQDPDHAETTHDFFRAKGQQIRNRLDLFPDGINVNFSYVLNQNRLSLVTYERGVEDITPACGTGAIATAVAWDYQKYQQGYHSGDEEADPDTTEQHIQVDCPGGPLEVTFEIENNNKRIYKNIALHGPAVTVYDGKITL